MKAIELVPIDAVTNQVRSVTVLGSVTYCPERSKNHWYADNNETGTAQFFATKAEAVQFASTGKA